MARVPGARVGEARVAVAGRDTSLRGGCILTRLKNDLLKGRSRPIGCLRLPRVHRISARVQPAPAPSPASDLLMQPRDDGPLIYIVWDEVRAS